MYHSNHSFQQNTQTCVWKKFWHFLVLNHLTKYVIKLIFWWKLYLLGLVCVCFNSLFLMSHLFTKGRLFGNLWSDVKILIPQCRCVYQDVLCVVCSSIYVLYFAIMLKFMFISYCKLLSAFTGFLEISYTKRSKWMLWFSLHRLSM